MSGRTKVAVSHSTRWAGKALLGKLPSSTNLQPPARLLPQAEISRLVGEEPRCSMGAFAPLPVSTSPGATVPSQVATAQLRFPPFPFSYPSQSWRKPLVWGVFFLCKRLNSPFSILGAQRDCSHRWLAWLPPFMMPFLLPD